MLVATAGMRPDSIQKSMVAGPTCWRSGNPPPAGVSLGGTPFAVTPWHAAAVLRIEVLTDGEQRRRRVGVLEQLGQVVQHRGVAVDRELPGLVEDPDRGVRHPRVQPVVRLELRGDAHPVSLERHVERCGRGRHARRGHAARREGGGGRRRRRGAGGGRRGGRQRGGRGGARGERQRRQARDDAEQRHRREPGGTRCVSCGHGAYLSRNRHEYSPIHTTSTKCQ